MYQKILQFWFDDIKPAQWWVKDNDFDQLIKDNYAALHASTHLCELYHWRQTPRGRLAEIIVLDQFSRNMYRDQPQSFASDPLALALSQEAIIAEADQELTPTEKSFLYMPFMHSESAAIHKVAVALYEANGIESNYQFELKHKAIIDEFGRYPHRNEILGRVSTPAELEFLSGPGSSF
jgi:uncharacterized protein (DUF924 family)|tara:strand:+ start:1105 stop:1641 length:537 start_codon:yes stop_codon:yes gene_type:complete